jgi:tRNA A-37 threonylcarbamoyl transferase component Bud32
VLFDAPTTRSVRTLQPGLVLGRYVVVDRIAAGGMAELYVARVNGPKSFEKAVALKLLHPHLADDPEFVRMFEKEARIAATLDHPNIVQVIDVDAVGAERFLVLEYVHGRDLRRILAKAGPLPLGAAVRVVVDVARALHFAHGKRDAGGRLLGLVHRDVSPANVLVSFHGAVKLADFGIAKMVEHTSQTATGSIKGKFGYMAPEQYLQEGVDPRSDVFSLGVVLYEASVGKRAFAGDQPATIMNKVLDGDWVAPRTVVPDYPEALAAIVARALAVDPGERFASAAELAEALESFAAAAGLDTRTETLSARVRLLFGDPPPPAIDVEARTFGAVTLSDGELTLRRRVWARPRVAVIAGLLSVGGVVGSLAGWAAARTQEDVARPNAQIDLAPENDAPVPAVAASVVAPADAVPAARVDSAPPSVPKRSSPRERPGEKKRAAKTKKASVPEPAPIKPRDGMFPRGMQ